MATVSVRPWQGKRKEWLMNGLTCWRQEVPWRLLGVGVSISMSLWVSPVVRPGGPKLSLDRPISSSV
jgi:hypothetical protein